MMVLLMLLLLKEMVLLVSLKLLACKIETTETLR